MDKNNESIGNETMEAQMNLMAKFDFLLGSWNLDYTIPKNAGTGIGTFVRALDDKYVFFDYATSSETGESGTAHGIFAWDEKTKLYRYWWFESSGNYEIATCNFVNDETLFMNWNDTLLIQTFKKVGDNKVILSMEHPDSEGEYQPILEVIFTRK